MSNFELSNEVDKDKVFLVNISEIEGRLDPFFNYHLKNRKLKSVFDEEQLYKISKPFSGGTPSKSNPDYWGGDIPWVSPKDFKGLYLTASEDTITQAGIDNSSTKLVPANSVIIVVRSGILIHSLPVTINKLPVTINQDLKAFVICDERVLPEYFGMYFFVFGKKLLPLITKHSTTVQSINTDQFSKLKIPIPTKDIQQLIVNEINKSIATKKQKEDEAEKLLNSIDDYLLGELGITLPEKDNSLSNRIFTTSLSKVSGGRFDPNHISKIEFINNKDWKYPKYRLKDLLIGNSQYGANEEAEEGKPETDVRYIRITDIDDFGILKNTGWKTAKTIDSQYFLNLNDILFARSGSVGRCYIHKEVEKPAIFAGYLIRFVVNPDLILPDYLFFYCNSAIYKFWVDAIHRPAVQANINSEEYKSLIIPVPPIDKQNEIAEHIKQIREQAKRLQNEAVAELEKSKQAVEQMILGS